MNKNDKSLEVSLEIKENSLMMFKCATVMATKKQMVVLRTKITKSKNKTINDNKTLSAKKTN